MFRINSRQLCSAGIWCAVAVSMSLSIITAMGAQSVALAWNASSSTSVAGYYLYIGTQSGTYTTRLDEGRNTQATVTGLTEGLTYHFALTAYSTARVESTPSPEIMYLVPGILAVTPATSAGNPLNMRFPVAPGHWYELQASVDLKSWVTLWQTDTATSNAWVGFNDSQSGEFPMRFYRLAAHAITTLPSPILRSANQIGSGVALTWDATVGQAYQVQYADNSFPGDWSNLGGAIAANSSTETMTYAIPPGAQWSYRVVVATPFPPPTFQSVGQSHNTITFTWNTTPGQMYQIQYTPSLTHPTWKNLGGIINAFGPTTTASDDIGPNPQRFYRAILAGTLPAPMIQSMAQNNGRIVFSWNSVAGQTYQVQYAASLDQPDWDNLGGIITALGTTTTASDAIGPAPRRFYRVTLLASSPAPVIESVTQANGTIAFTWNSTPGRSYLVQYTSSLDQPDWNNLSTAVAFDYTTTAYDLIGSDFQRFYRVILQQ